jgi:hypothetical protein
LVGYAFVTGLASRIGNHRFGRAQDFDVPEPIPPPPEPEIEPAQERRPEEEGAASPPNIKSKPRRWSRPLPR